MQHGRRVSVTGFPAGFLSEKNLPASGKIYTGLYPAHVRIIK
jgi:hypothetical protein